MVSLKPSKTSAGNRSLLFTLCGVVLALVALVCIKYSKLTHEYNALRISYNNLFQTISKSDTVWLRDTIRLPGTVVPKIVRDSVLVTDTVFLTQHLYDRTYSGSVTNEQLELNYNALVRGWLLDINFDAVILSSHITTNPTPSPVILKPNYKFSIGAGYGFNNSGYLTFGYHRNRLTYRLIWLNKNIFAGVDFNF